MAVPAKELELEVVDLELASLRELNQRLHDLSRSPGPRHWRILNPNGAHALACGLDAAGWRSLAARLSAEAGVAPVLAAPAEVEVSLRESASGARHLFVLNHRHEEIRVSMEKLRGVDLLTGRKTGPRLALPALGAAVIHLD